MRALYSIWKAAIQEALAKRSAFYFDVIVMCLNDMFWLIFWGVFFSHTKMVKGWDLHHTLMLFALGTTVHGLANGFMANLKHLGKMAFDGQLDAALTLPVDTLTYLLIRKINASAIGDLCFGIGLLAIAVRPTLEATAIFVVVALLGTVVLSSFLVLLGASVLLFGGRGDQTTIGFEAVTIFSFYPIDFFGGPTKVLLFTVIPAAFITSMPVKIITNFSWGSVSILAAVAVTFAVLARLAFTTGLRHYRSGSQWTSA